MTTPPNFDMIMWAALFRFYEASTKHDSTAYSYSASELQSRFFRLAGVHFVSRVLLELHNNGLLHSQNGKFEISAGGIRRVEKELSVKTSYAHLYKTHGDNWLFPDGASIESMSSKSPRVVHSEADEFWEPLKIERETKQYASAVEETEKAIKTIEGDNGYAVQHPEERQTIVWSLKQGLEALKEKLPSKAQIKSLLLQPLKFLSEKFSGAIIGEAAKSAWAALKALFGI